MKKSYVNHFDQRGSAYDQAMRLYPDARQQEFAQAVKAAQVVPGMTVADVPAGGGYLQRYLPMGSIWMGHEPCSSFTNHGLPAAKGLPLLPLPWCEGAADVAISLAGVHHIEDKHPLFEELWRVVKPGGRLVVSDVAAGSKVARFLDGYVGQHNSTGHEGVYLDAKTLEELRLSGWTIESCSTSDFDWVFSDREAMGRFCHSLFDLRTTSVHETRAAIESELGVVDLADGATAMAWSLLTVVACKPF